MTAIFTALILALSGSSYPVRRSGARLIGRKVLESDDVEHLWLARHLYSRCLDVWAERLAERGQLLTRFPNLADAKVVLVAETDVEQASGSGPIPGLFERVVDGVVLASRHVGSWKSDNDAHGDLLGGIVEDLTLWARRGVPNVCCATLGLDLLSDY